MLETLDISCYSYDSDLTSKDYMVKTFGIDGLRMLVIDMIVANDDRHYGNIGVLRDTSTGIYKGLAPLWDFDASLSNCSTYDYMTDMMLAIYHDLDSYLRDEVVRICKTTMEVDTVETFKFRAERLLKEVSKL